MERLFWPVSYGTPQGSFFVRQRATRTCLAVHFGEHFVVDVPVSASLRRHQPRGRQLHTGRQHPFATKKWSYGTPPPGGSRLPFSIPSVIGQDGNRHGNSDSARRSDWRCVIRHEPWTWSAGCRMLHVGLRRRPIRPAGLRILGAVILLYTLPLLLCHCVGRLSLGIGPPACRISAASSDMFMARTWVECRMTLR